MIEERDENWTSYLNQIPIVEDSPSKIKDPRSKPKVPHNAKGRVVSPPKRKTAMHISAPQSINADEDSIICKLNAFP